MLMEESEYLVDDKALEECRGKNLKEQFSIKIDSIRKSLGIDSMDDVELLVDCLYSYQELHDRQVEEERKIQAERDALEEEEAVASGVTPGQTNNQANEAKKSNNGADATNSASGGHDESEEGEEKDPTALNLEPELIVLALTKFHQDREDRKVEENMLGPKSGKSKRKSKFESVEE